MRPFTEHPALSAEAGQILGPVPNRLDATIEVTCEPAPRGRLKNCISDDANATLARATETLFERHAITRRLSIAERPYYLRVRYSWTGTTQ
ncbi:hypothetical protein [Asticcacaulis sp. AND118]|uniref:hypothetical protein n=1 Tax=Asticcacaulis sp. AND118 TaxID=2840468 RepID=UPI001CFF7E99|nr:hypothetical protein [Asticcacaulis sp. AND118]UDF03914.1 hypothetical protein LH365_02410 [Asticcacaulis sp. AND118]